MAPAETTAVRVEVCFSPAPRTVWSRALVLPAGSTAADALRASGLLQQYPQSSGCMLARWGRACEATVILRDGDRLEVLRPLKADPKESRRLRYRGQPARTRTAAAVSAAKR